MVDDAVEVQADAAAVVAPDAPADPAPADPVSEAAPVAAASAAIVVDATPPAGPVTITPLDFFAITRNGVVVSFAPGEAREVSADELAVIVAAGAPFTQV